MPQRAQGRGPFDGLRAIGCGARVHVESGEGNHGGLPLRAQGCGPFDRLRANGCGARVHVESGEGNHEGCPYELRGAGPSTGSGRTGAGRVCTLKVERATTRVAPASSGGRALRQALGERVRVACARGTWRGQPRGLPLRVQGHGPFYGLWANGCGAWGHVGRGEGNHEGCPYELRGAGPSTGSGRTGAGACARGKWRGQPRGLPLRAQGRGPFERLWANGCGEGNHEGCPYEFRGTGPSTAQGERVRGVGAR